MNNKILDYIKKYDRSIVLILTAIFIGISTYVTLTNTIKETSEMVKTHTYKIEVLDKFDTIQFEINKTMKEKLDKIENKIDSLLRK